jgi:hypothetical protein
MKPLRTPKRKNQLKNYLQKNLNRKRKKTINVFGILLLIFAFSFSQCEKRESTLSELEKSELISNSNKLLTDWHLAAGEANYEKYFGKMDSISVFIGTDATENWNKTEFAAFSKPYFDKGKTWSFSAIDRNIYTNNTGSILWFDELLDTWMGLCRGSGVIEYKDGKLKIKHYVLSVTVPNDDIAQLINIKRAKDSLFISSFNSKNP